MKIEGYNAAKGLRLGRALPALLVIAIIAISVSILYRLFSDSKESELTDVVELPPVSVETDRLAEKYPKEIMKRDEANKELLNLIEEADPISLKENREKVLKEVNHTDESKGKKSESVSRQEDGEEARSVLKEKEAEEALQIARQKESEKAQRIARQKEAEEALQIARQKESEKALQIARQKAAKEAQQRMNKEELERTQQAKPQETERPEETERLDSEWIARNWDKAREVEVVALLSEAESQLVAKQLSVSALNTAMDRYRSLEEITGGDPRVSELYSKILDSHVILAKQQEKLEKLSDAMTTIDNGLALDSHHLELLNIKKKVSKKIAKIENFGQSAPLIGTF
ncbi:MAG: hypothetical protein DSZ28_08860 [Thiothrix sp.]|nr:MAG: hypothetical protein DSZ28_08860 [Thiothrix sp.]